MTGAGLAYAGRRAMPIVVMPERDRHYFLADLLPEKIWAKANPQWPVYGSLADPSFGSSPTSAAEGNESSAAADSTVGSGGEEIQPGLNTVAQPDIAKQLDAATKAQIR